MQTAKTKIILVAVFSMGLSSQAEAGCGVVPGKIKEAFATALKFSESCAAATLSEGKKIAVNDYTVDGGETMYIFDQNGRCLKTAAITFGDGKKGRNAPPRSCATNGSEMTPAGIHITGFHHGSNYKSYESLLLAGLSGQGSASRAILIHPSRYGVRAAVSNGCTGVDPEDLQEVKKLLGYGSLVYNFFGPRSAGCDNNAGSDNPPVCRPEAAAVAAATSFNGVSKALASRNSQSILAAPNTGVDRRPSSQASQWGQR